MNKAIFTGRLGSTPELKTTQSGVSVCTFTIAVDRPKISGKQQETDWLTIVAWRNLADFASRYLTKGRKVLVTATVRTRTYDDKDGKTRKVTEFYAEDIEFCDNRPNTEAPGETTPTTESSNRFTEYTEPNEDLPF